jgi:transcriptional regulator with XRE-family HTH domain
MRNLRYYENALAKWMTQMREEKGISQEALGVQIGKGQSDIAKIENGSKKVSVLEMISWMAALDIPFERIEDVLKPIYSGLSDKKQPKSNEY